MGVKLLNGDSFSFAGCPGDDGCEGYKKMKLTPLNFYAYFLTVGKNVRKMISDKLLKEQHWKAGVMVHTCKTSI